MNSQHYQNEFRILGYQCWLSRRRRCPQGIDLTSDCVGGRRLVCRVIPRLRILSKGSVGFLYAQLCTALHCAVMWILYAQLCSDVALICTTVLCISIICSTLAPIYPTNSRNWKPRNAVTRRSWITNCADASIATALVI